MAFGKNVRARSGNVQHLEEGWRERERERERDRERDREEREEQEREGVACWLASGFRDRCEREANCSASGAEGTQQGRAGDRFNIFSEELIPFHEVV